MKKFLHPLLVSVAIFFSSTANAGIETLLTNICKVIETDDVSTLRSKMKQAKSTYNMKLTFYYSGITCSDNTLIQWAFRNDASKTGTLIVKRLRKSELRDADYLAWASSNNLSNQAIIDAITKRIE